MEPNRPRRVSTTKRILAAAAVLLLLGGCARTDQKKLVAFLAGARSPVGCREYRVMPPDVISINARPTEEYPHLMVRIGPDGRASLPLVGEFDLADKTTTQIAAELTELLRDYYEDVQVTVMVTDYRSQRFYVYGEVNRPGVYSYTGTDTLLSALAAAGLNRLAMPEKIQLIRGMTPMPAVEEIELDEKGKIKGDVQKITINLWDMARDGKMSGDVLLANNDVIYVPANPLAKVGLALQNLLRPATPAIQAVHVPADMVSEVEPEVTSSSRRYR